MLVSGKENEKGLKMCNDEIIHTAQMLAGICEECHTYSKWKQLGYQVQRGSKAVFQATIWKHTTCERDGEIEERMFMQKASFFSRSQVEKIK